jgi:hypothetical protein
MNKERLFYRWSNCVPSFDLKIKLPDGIHSFQWVQPDNKWKMMDINFADPNAIDSWLDKEFYVVYKKVMQ